MKKFWSVFALLPFCVLVGCGSDTDCNDEEIKTKVYKTVLANLGSIVWRGGQPRPELSFLIYLPKNGRVDLNFVSVSEDSRDDKSKNVLCSGTIRFVMSELETIPGKSNGTYYWNEKPVGKKLGEGDLPLRYSIKPNLLRNGEYSIEVGW